MAEEFSLYQTPEWSEADDFTRADLDRKASQAELLAHPGFKEEYIAADENTRLELEQMTRSSPIFSPSKRMF